VLAGRSLAGPTSLNRGEGLLTGLAHDVGASEGWAGGGGRREDERTSTVMALMFD
jgi:hypothetical protein